MTSRLGEPFVLFPLIALVLIGVVWGTTLNLIRVEHGAARASAATAALEAADTYEAHVVRAMREIDQTLKLLALVHDRDDGKVDLKLLRERGLLLPEILFSVTVQGRNGEILSTTRPADAKNLGIAVFLREATHADAIAISRPVWSDADKEWKMHFRRALVRGDRGGDGAVVVSVSASYFVSGYEPSKLGAAGVLGLVGRDGVFRVRRTGDAIVTGDEVDYRAISALAKSEEARLSDNSWDGHRRYTAARELFDYPLALVAGVDEAELLTPVQERTRTYLWRAVGGTAFLVLLLGLLGRVSWQLGRTRIEANDKLNREVAVRRQKEVELNLRNRAIESSVNAILIIDAATRRIQYANPAFESITGYVEADATGREMQFLLGEERNQPGMHEIVLAMREKREAHAVLRCYRQDGTPFWNECFVAPVRAEDDDIVTHYVAVMNDVTESKRDEEQLAHQANYDALTDLANRNLLQDRLAQAIKAARRDGSSIAVVFLDLDNFKLVNDSVGHDMGDELLQEMARRLKASVRDTDTVARLGGDEFVILMQNRKAAPGVVEGDITTLMDKLLGAIAEPVNVGPRRVRPTGSIGVSVYPQDGADATTLLSNADAAMYRAKELGRNRFQFFTADVHERLRTRMELESSLRHAIEREEFELHYQPQVALSTGRIIGMEALIRWRHPERGLIGPAHFIGFAEETGLIVPIGHWALREACRQNKAWQDAGLPKMPVAVNMSVKQCEQPDVVEVVQKTLRDSGLEPQYLELEITESISMADPERSVPLMQRLKALGVIIAIDDFGTGFSSLSYLRRFPVDRLKIDLSFVREIATDSSSLAISEAIITLSHSLALEVIAEGVETEEQLTLLGSRDCDYMQGYFFSPPVPAAQLGDMLERNHHIDSLVLSRVNAKGKPLYEPV
jgi:diguanylate cyclase (GGDEF)-like protein/PAS domain S-box-containing protein